MSGGRLDVRPEPTPEEAAAIRRALEALGLIDRGQGSTTPPAVKTVGSGPPPSGVTRP